MLTLDRDGDLDYVINNINEEAFVYQNRSENFNQHRYLNVRFQGSEKNRAGIGAIAEVYQGEAIQTFENSPYRGYLSSVDDGVHFGLGAATKVDSLVVKWPDGKRQVIKNIAANQTLYAAYQNSTEMAEPAVYDPATALFANVTKESGIDYIHNEFDFIDFNQQRLIPRKLSQFGPSIAIGDVDNNGLDDMVIGSSADNLGSYFLQQPGGKFVQKELPPATGADARRPEMMGLLLFDADDDGDLDLYTCSGSSEYAPNTKNYQDQFYVNTGAGTFVHDPAATPKNFTSKSCIKAADFDSDGDLDLFIGGRVKPERYPEPVSSVIYRNDSKNGKVVFTDVTAQVAPMLTNIGLVCDAVWTDFDNDGRTDLILAGEWMPLTFLKNNGGHFSKLPATGDLQNKSGWWNSITAGDFDNDGDMDYIAGNLGLNSFLRASEKEPVGMYAADFDEDPAFDAVTTMYLPGTDGVRKEFPVNQRDEMVKQMVSTRRKFHGYKNYAVADINALLNKGAQEKAIKLKANYFESVYIQNNGAAGFAVNPLPVQAQLAPLNGLLAEDVNGDGFLDIVVNGNDFGNEVSNGRYDAMNGLVLLGDGNGGLQPLTLQQSGFFVPGDAKGLAKMVIGNKAAIAATQNRDRLQLFSLRQQPHIIRIENDDVAAWMLLKNGKKQKREIPWGTSFLSQSARFLLAGKNVLAVEVMNRKGQKRRLENKPS
jgi:hypothetical protein